MENQFFYNNLKHLLHATTCLPLSNKKRILVISDLHTGDGSKRDDFLKNNDLLINILKDYYFPEKFTLILNGDIEELHKFSYSQIYKNHLELYKLFDLFFQSGRLLKIVGNHDYELLLMKDYTYRDVLHHAVCFQYRKNSLLVFHGHQASSFYENYNFISSFLIRHVSSPLHLKNPTAAYDSRRRYAIEKKVYRFSSREKIVSIIGHTHRPLFESLSKTDDLKFRIETLCQAYPAASVREKKRIETEIRDHKEELKKIRRRDHSFGIHHAIYNTDIIVPCVFNSGSGIGKRGITGIEIMNGKISLIHWFDRRRREKYYRHYENFPVQLGHTPYFKMTMRKASLDYIFTRIRLLS